MSSGKFKYSILALCFFAHICKAQNTSGFFVSDSSYNKNRLALVATTESVLYTCSILGLNELWYKDYPRSSFHFFDDNNEWMQMDKAGHFATSYNVGKTGMKLLQWSGVKRQKAIWYGGLLGFVYLGSIEMLDGFSTQWGFSWGDIFANTAGSITLIGQEYIWHEQRVLIKFSAAPSNYSKYRPNVLGSSFTERLLKDYNGQTYWASVNISSFLNEKSKFPKWLNMAIGYGADGMTGGSSNPVYIDSNGNAVSFERYRQYYFSFDIDLSRINVKSPLLKTIFEAINFIKIPSPSLEFNKHGMKGHIIYF